LDEIRADREARRALILDDPLPVDSNTMWVSAGRGALIGIFLLLFGTFLYVSRPILLPIMAAAVLALTLGPLIKAAKRVGIPTWVTAILILLFGFGALSLLAMALAHPVSEWIGRAPEIGANIKDKLAVLDQPLAALRELQASLFGDNAGVNVNMPASNVVLPVVAFVTPAAGELVLFFTTLLFFLVGEIQLRNQFVTLFGNRDSKLRFLKIMRDIERNLAGYLTVVTIVNIGIAIIVSLGAWLIGFPNPLIFGVAGRLVQLRALYRAGGYGRRPIWRRTGHFSFARACLDRAARFGRAHDARRPPYYPDACRTKAHAQSTCALSGFGILDLDVGPNGYVARCATVHYRPRDCEPLVSVGRRPVARVNGTFAAPKGLS
jgi:hypothetical protein